MTVRTYDKPIATLRSHPLARLFPPMTTTQYEVFKGGIARYGQGARVLVWRDRVVDGLECVRVCEELGLPLKIYEWDANEDGALTIHVIKQNLLWRQLNTSQRAMIAERITRRTRGGTAYQRDSDYPDSLKLTQTAAATHFGIGEKAIGLARRVKDQGIPELIAKVESGKLPIYRAAEIAQLSHLAQRNLIAPTTTARRSSPEADRVDRAVDSMCNVAEILAETTVNGSSQRPTWARRLRKVRKTLTRFIAECER